MADPKIGQGYNADIAYRYKPGQSAAEFYSQKTGQTFGSADELSGYVNSNYQGANADPQNVFGVLAGGYTPRAQALDQIKTDLNAYQQQTFNSEQPTNKRASSSLVDSIAAEQDNYQKYLDEFTDLKTKLGAITAPNYSDLYKHLRDEQGVPGFEQSYLDLSQKRRELPYVERAATGNAGVATESQLANNTAQKDIPLYIQQANVLDRLKLAQDFVTNSLNLKEKDFGAAQDGLKTAIGLVTNGIDMSRTHLNDLTTRQKEERDLATKAQEFALQNGIDTPLYQVGNVIYDTATQTPKYVNNGGTISTVDGKQAFSKPEQFFKDSGVNSFDQIYQINSTTVADKNAVLDLRQKYPDAGISSTDTFATASSKLQNSRIYQDQVRGPVGSGGSGGSGGVLGLSNQQIDNISPLVTQFQNSPIVQNYNTIGEGYKFANSISSDSKNPSDHQALIYAFAKAMDPGSVVREGEYATVQKYAQSWVKSYGKSVEQAINGTGFLSQSAINGIKATIATRFKASESSYQNLYGETSRRINLIGGTDKGDQLLNNYGGAFAQPSSSSSFVGPTNPSSQPAEQPTQNNNDQGFWKKATNWLFGD